MDFLSHHHSRDTLLPLEWERSTKKRKKKKEKKKVLLFSLERETSSIFVEKNRETRILQNQNPFSSLSFCVYVCVCVCVQKLLQLPCVTITVQTLLYFKPGKNRELFLKQRVSWISRFCENPSFLLLKCSSTWCRCSPWWLPIILTTSLLITFNRFLFFFFFFFLFYFCLSIHLSY